MANFTSVRGWLEVNEGMIDQVRAVLQETAQNAALSTEQQNSLQLYNRGWIFSADHINWTRFIFFGADIRTQHVDWLKEQIKTIAEKVGTSDREFRDYPSGLFYADDEDGNFSVCWKVEDGQFHEVAR